MIQNNLKMIQNNLKMIQNNLKMIQNNLKMIHSNKIIKNYLGEYIYLINQYRESVQAGKLGSKKDP
jgi:predicted DNA-binding protein (UPF0278 family)